MGTQYLKSWRVGPKEGDEKGRGDGGVRAEGCGGGGGGIGGGGGRGQRDGEPEGAVRRDGGGGEDVPWRQGAGTQGALGLTLLATARMTKLQ